MVAFLSADADLLSLDCPAVAMRLEDVMKAKSPQVLVWHCQLCQPENKQDTFILTSCDLFLFFWTEGVYVCD